MYIIYVYVHLCIYYIYVYIYTCMYAYIRRKLCILNQCCLNFESF